MPMTNNPFAFSLGDYLQAIAAPLPTTLVPPSDLAAAIALLAKFPAQLADTLFLEIRLGRSDAPVDVSFSVRPAAARVLHAILDTEISPELVPAKDGKIQSTEGTVGPYALNDFFLFYVTRFGLKPSKVAYLAHQAWKDASSGHWPAGTPDDERVEYDLATIKSWLRKFLVRFFQTSQFKRSALPNGPKVVTGGSLSPRGDWRAPSDATARVWLDELEAGVPD